MYITINFLLVKDSKVNETVDKIRELFHRYIKLLDLDPSCITDPGIHLSKTDHPLFYIEIPAGQYKNIHSKDNIKKLITMLDDKNIKFNEAYINIECGGSFFSNQPPIISDKKMTPQQIKNANHYDYLYHMSDQKFNSQNVYKTQLIRYQYVKPAEASYFLERKDEYVVDKQCDYYEVKDRLFNLMIGSIGYFHLIKIKDIDNRIIDELIRTKRFIIEKQEDWWFILKKKLDF